MGDIIKRYQYKSRDRTNVGPGQTRRTSTNVADWYKCRTVQTSDQYKRRTKVISFYRLV